MRHESMARNPGTQSPVFSASAEGAQQNPRNQCSFLSPISVQSPAGLFLILEPSTHPSCRRGGLTGQSAAGLPNPRINGQEPSMRFTAVERWAFPLRYSTFLARYSRFKIVKSWFKFHSFGIGFTNDRVVLMGAEIACRDLQPEAVGEG